MRLDAEAITVRAGGRALVDGASLAVAPGEVVGLIGPNGAGKSTLLRALAGVRPRAAGAVRLDGRALEDLPPRARAKAMAYLPQDRRVEWRLSVDDVVTLGRFPHQSGFGGVSEACRAAVDRAIARVGAGALRDRPVSVLSGGERALVFLARALATEAPLLLADEPTAALDPYHQLRVMEILRDEAGRGAGVLAVIHDLALAARFADRVVVMQAGRVAAEGAPKDVLVDEVVRDVYRVALRGDRSLETPWERAG